MKKTGAQKVAEYVRQNGPTKVQDLEARFNGHAINSAVDKGLIVEAPTSPGGHNTIWVAA